MSLLKFLPLFVVTGFFITNMFYYNQGTISLWQLHIIIIMVLIYGQISYLVMRKEEE